MNPSDGDVALARRATMTDEVLVARLRLFVTDSDPVGVADIRRLRRSSLGDKDAHEKQPSISLVET